MAKVQLRTCAIRSRSAKRSSLSAVATPGFSDEPSHDDDHLREGHPEVDDPPLTLRNQTSFLWALCQELVRSTTQRLVAPSGAGLPFSEVSASSPRSLSRLRVTFESEAGTG